MAGILGIVGDGTVAELGSMADRMVFRGTRLSVVNPASGVLFGEIHHAADGREPKSSLCLDSNGALFPTDSEESAGCRLERELLQRGVAALRDVGGHFALAWWDEANLRTTLACDRQGFKSLYYVELPGRIAFASEYKALLALPDCPAELDRDVLQTYLVLFSCPQSRSLLKGIMPLPQAAVLHIGNGVTNSDRYWQPQRRHTKASFGESAMLLRAKLEAAVSAQLAVHDRGSLLLSGGFDSAALLALVRHVRPDLEVATYTIGHSAEDPDIVGARAVAAHFGTVHHEHFYSPKELSRDLPRMVWQTEDLSGREEAILQSTITAIAARNGEIVLAGHGADAAFGGMPRHRILWMRDRAPPPLRGALCELFVFTRYKRMPQSWLGRQLVALAYRGDLPKPPQLVDAYAIGADDPCKSLDRYLEEHYSPSSGFLHDEPVLAESAAPMALPFLEPLVTEWALSCPGSYHVSFRQQKRLLRASLADLMPPAMLASRKTIQRLKHDSELTDALEGIARTLDLGQSLAERKLVPISYVLSLSERSLQGALSPERVHSMWGLICTELWMRQFIDRRGETLGVIDVLAR